jgi:hypothetical protein
MVDPRLLAKAAGAATRTYEPATALLAITERIGGDIAQCGVAVVEFLDLLRFYLRQETLESVLERPAQVVGPTKRAKPRAAATRLQAPRKSKGRRKGA